MSLSADQREAIARALRSAVIWPADFPEMADDIADDVAALVDGWLGEARRDEQERIKAGIEALTATRLEHPAEGVITGGALPSYPYIRRLDVLGVIEGSEAGGYPLASGFTRNTDGTITKGSEATP